MKRRPILRGILSAGVIVQLGVILCSPPLHAQQGLVPGMEDTPGAPHQSAFTGSTPIPEQHVLTADHAPGDLHGITRYPTGLPMAGAQVVILNADVDVERSTTSAEDGSYTFKGLKPGQYQLSAKIDGYVSPEIMNVNIIPGKSISSDISLKSSRNASVIKSSGSGYRSYNGSYHAESASLRLTDPSPSTDSPADRTVRTAEATNSAIAADVPKPAEAPAASPIPAAVADELAAMRKRIDELEMELKGRAAPDQPAAEAPITAAPQGTEAAQAPATPPPPKPGPGQYLSTAGTVTNYAGDVDIPTHPAGWDPFSYADWTWMNANGRNEDSPWSTKYFTPEFRADVNYIDDFNHPRDDTMGGSTESFRSNEWQLEQ